MSSVTSAAPAVTMSTNTSLAAIRFDATSVPTHLEVSSILWLRFRENKGWNELWTDFASAYSTFEHKSIVDMWNVQLPGSFLTLYELSWVIERKFDLRDFKATFGCHGHKDLEDIMAESVRCSALVDKMIQQFERAGS